MKNCQFHISFFFVFVPFRNISVHNTDEISEHTSKRNLYTNWVKCFCSAVMSWVFYWGKYKGKFCRKVLRNGLYAIHITHIGISGRVDIFRPCKNIYFYYSLINFFASLMQWILSFSVKKTVYLKGTLSHQLVAIK